MIEPLKEIHAGYLDESTLEKPAPRMIPYLGRVNSILIYGDGEHFALGSGFPSAHFYHFLRDDFSLLGQYIVKALNMGAGKKASQA
jgi:hypothetical protein